jgi:hypothetical protein
MRIDHALNVKVGDHLINTFMDDVVVTSIYKEGGVIVFGTIDTRLRQVAYAYDYVYLLDIGPNDISDEESSFMNWAKENRESIEEQLENLDLIKQSYTQGFDAGFSYKKIISHEELMQK